MADGGRRRRGDADSWLFRHVDLRLAAGERIAIEGRSGAGKTVLLRSTVLLDPLDEGRVTWQGRALSAEAVPEFRSQVLYLHQTPSLWEGSVEDNLRLPFTLRCHRGRTFQRRDAVSILHDLGRDEAFLQKQQRDLSGGEAQLVALTRALLLEPAVLLLDEPTSGLDAEATAAVERLILSWSRRRPEAGSYLWICHDEAQRQRVGDRRWIVDGGSLLTGDEQ